MRHVEQEDQDDEPRFTLLETIREFALEQLQASGEVDQVRGAHAAWSLSAATEWRSQVWGPQQREIQQSVATEADNFRAALEWLLERGDVQQAANLVIALVDFWYIRSQLREATEWLERVNAHLQQLPPAIAAAITSRLATFLQPQGDDARATELAEHAVEMQRKPRDTPEFDGRELAFALFVASASQTDPARQKAMLEEALTHYRALGDKAWQGHTLSHLALASSAASEPDQAIAFAEEAVDIQREAQNEWGLSLAKIILAELLRVSGDALAALRHFQETLEIVRHGQDLWHIANCLQCIAAILTPGEHARTAALLFGAATHLRARYGAIRESELWDFEPELAAEIRAAIGDHAYTEAFIAGIDTPLDEIVAVALSQSLDAAVSTGGTT